MASPVATTGAVLRGSDGEYEIGGKKYPSVTAVLRTAEALGLDDGIGYVFGAWTADEADNIVRAALDTGVYLRPSVTMTDEKGRPYRTAEPVDVGQWQASGEMKKHLARHGRRKLDMAADRGKIVHHAVGHLAHGEPVSGSDILAHYSDGLCPDDKTEDCVNSLAGWWEANDISAVAVEISGVNTEYGYAGTIDMVGNINGTAYIVDFKTSDQWRLTHMLQVAAYRAMCHWVERTPDGLFLSPCPPGTESLPTLVVLVGTDTVKAYRVEPEQADKFFVMFRKLLDLKLGWQQAGTASRVKSLDWSLFGVGRA